MKASTTALLLGAAQLSAAAFSLEIVTDLGTPYTRVTASQANLFVGLADQEAQCEVSGCSWASFYLDVDRLFLLTPAEIQQQVFTDRSGMGQGHVGYVTNQNGPLPGHFETEGWALDEGGNLNFKGIGLVACPHSIEDSWSLWLDVGDSHGGNGDCVAIQTRTLTEEEQGRDPAPCIYT